MQQLTLAFNSTGFHIRHSTRAKRLRVLITPVGNVELVVPSGTSLDHVQQFLQAQNSWINHKQRHITSLRSEYLDQRLPTVIRLPAINENWNVVYGEDHPSLKQVRDVSKKQVLHLNTTNENKAGIMLKSWLTRRAKSTLLPWLAQASKKTGLKYSTASIRGQKTRWASCSSKKNISLNRCMLFLEPEQVHYLLVHELCHTREMNHSHRFWQLVSQYVPNYMQHEKYINEQCYKLPRWAY